MLCMLRSNQTRMGMKSGNFQKILLVTTLFLFLPCTTPAKAEGFLVFLPAILAASQGAKQGPEYDNDVDGYNENQGDCDDGNNSIYPGAAEVCGDGIDQDCSGIDLACSPNILTVTSTGQIWMDRDLGASRAATSYNDVEAYGDLYQWGRGTDGHEKRTSALIQFASTTDNPGHDSFIIQGYYPFDWRKPQNDNLWQGVSGINNPCPAGFRLPTETELNTERASWTSQNSAGAFASPLKLVVAGYRDRRNGTLLRRRYLRQLLEQYGE